LLNGRKGDCGPGFNAAAPFDDPFFAEWLTLPPALADTDLRGALCVSREHAPLITPEDRLSSEAAELLTALLQHPEMSSSLKDRLLVVPRTETAVIMDRLLDRARREQEWGVPAVLEACLVVADADPPQGARLAAFLAERPAAQIQANIVSRGIGKMGTSQSSGGPGSGVSMVPSWTPPPPTSEVTGSEAEGGDAPTDDGGTPPQVQLSVVVPIAPPARFLGVRRALSEFARSGDGQDMRRSIGHYVRTGYGGSARATRRFGGTASTAGVLGAALARVAEGQPAEPGSALDPALLAGRDVQEVMNAVVEAVRPIDGTQDAEAERAAIRDALTQLLTRFPDADLLHLDPEQRAFVIESFTAIDVFRRFELDVGRTIVEKAPSAVTALSRLKEVRDYVTQSVAAAFRKLRNAGRSLTSGRISEVVRDALSETFDVFEGYAE
jgi:hypothetical protein